MCQVFRGTSRNFNPDCAMAAKYTIAEVLCFVPMRWLTCSATPQVEEIVEAGQLKPEDVHLPGVYVKAIVKANIEKKIEVSQSMLTRVTIDLQRLTLDTAGTKCTARTSAFPRSLVVAAQGKEKDPAAAKVRERIVRRGPSSL